MGTIPTLWPTVQQWLVQQPQHVAQHPLLPAFLRAEAQGGLAMRGEGGERGDRLLEGGSSSSSIGHGGGGSGSSSSGNNPFHAAQYTGGHMWSNFEIGRLSFFRSEAYRSFFRHLDLSGGFFYERSVAVGQPSRRCACRVFDCHGLPAALWRCTPGPDGGAPSTHHAHYFPGGATPRCTLWELHPFWTAGRSTLQKI